MKACIKSQRTARKDKSIRLPSSEYHHKISRLHYCHVREDFDELCSETLNRWKNLPELNAFHDYFKKQWLTSPFNKWQLYHLPAGLASTNNPLEQYNNRIKEDFTKRLKQNVKTSLETFETLIEYESDHIAPIRLHPRISKVCRDLAHVIVEKNLLKKIAEDKFTYKHADNSISIINVSSKSCSCLSFHDKAICKHLVVACMETRSNLPGLVVMPKILVTRWRRQKRNKNYTSPIASNRVARAIESTVESAFDSAAIETFDTVLVATKKRGRPRKADVEANGPALVVDNLIRIDKNTKNAKKSTKSKIFATRSSTRGKDKQ
jgi:hypothetical protein